MLTMSQEAGPELVLEKWLPHFDKLLDLSAEARQQQQHSRLYRTRTRKAIPRTPLVKALECNGIPNEVTKCAKEVVGTWLHGLYNLAR